jgi:hypothetical protein
VTRQHAPDHVPSKADVFSEEEDDINQEVIDLGPNPSDVLDRVSQKD